MLKQKKLHEQFFNQIEEAAGEERWLWLREEIIKRNRITNYGSTRTGHYDKDKTQAESKCRLCGKLDETVRHIVCECPMLTQREYKRRHDLVGRKIHWKVCRKIGFDVNEK